MRIAEMLLVNDLVEKLLRPTNTKYVFSYTEEVWRKALVVISFL